MPRVAPIARIRGVSDPGAGLSTKEAEERIRVFGGNQIVKNESSGWGDVIRDTARDPMLWFLTGTTLLFAFLGDYSESVILALAIIPIVGMDAYLHRRTQASTESLSGRLDATATVVRDGREQHIAAEALVPGDLVIVNASHSFPADGIVVSGDAIQVDESALTGEAMPVRKHPLGGLDTSHEELAIDEQSWASAGTRLLTGAARLRVVWTGADTVYGQIVRSAQEGHRERTPLQIAIDALLAVLVVAALILCLSLAVIRYAQGNGLTDALLSAVTLAVAALPEEFPVVFTFFLSVGVYRLAKHQALVRRSVVVESIGRVTCICTDKTGTITEGRLRLEQRTPNDGVSQEELQRIARIASRAESGDPLDAAINEDGGETEDRVATFPFTEDRRRETGVVRIGDEYLVAVKGAPEAVLALCDISEAERAAWLVRVGELGARAYKVIACASLMQAQWNGGEPDRGFRFTGLLAFGDPVRSGVLEAVAQAKAAGIRVIMVTGDHVATAAAVAREIGIGKGEPKVLEGSALDAALKGANGRLPDVDVVARAIPTQKLDLVRALRARGEFVAVTGDGVNDVPALQGADVGIAMGKRGASTTREVASIVLLDDNFRTIVRAIAEGRQLFRNLKLSFAYLLMVHLPLVLTAALIPLAGYPLLYLPIHIVWLELIIHPTALLVFQELPTDSALEPVERGARRRFFTAREWAVIACVGMLITIMLVFGYAYSLGTENNVAHARTMSLVTLILAAATVTAWLSRLQTRTAGLTVLITILSAIVLVQTPILAAWLHLTPLHADDWLIAAAGGVIAASPAAILRTARHTNFYVL
jgi:Ca2+-transporting ATPase